MTFKDLKKEGLKNSTHHNLPVKKTDIFYNICVGWGMGSIIRKFSLFVEHKLREKQGMSVFL